MSCRDRIIRVLVGLSVILAAVAPLGAAGGQPWVITTPVTVNQPTDVGDVIVADGGVLTVENVPDPGLRLTGNLWVIGHGRVVLKDSVIEFMSTYHGQYALAVVENGSAVVSGCDYRVPNHVQHALFSADNGTIEVEDTNFESVQLIATGTSSFTASRLNGNFEVILQGSAGMTLTDIPRDPGQGRLWVWPEFPDGSRAVYTPPPTGFVSSWDFPPVGAEGIPDHCHLERCQVLLWPLLVKPGADLTLRDILESNRVVVGFHMPNSATITGLKNGETVAQKTLPLTDRVVRLENASIDTWNLYPEQGARVVVRDSVIGEMITFGGAVSVLERTTVDGSGGYFGATDTSHSVARNCTFTCDIQASGRATIELHDCDAEPYPNDPTGAATRFGAFDEARLFADQTQVNTTTALGGSGLIAVAWIENPPAAPPAHGQPVTLFGGAALYSLAGGPAPGYWRLGAVRHGSREALQLGRGPTQDGRIQLATWDGANSAAAYELRLVLTDAWGRTLTGRHKVPASRFPPLARSIQGSRTQRTVKRTR